MSWPQWSAGAQPTLPSVVNPSTPLINPAPAVVTPGLQYTQDQWTQMQQQNWQQWAQWQQQYQQWHQQYGAEYQKSINAMSSTGIPPQPVQHSMSGLPNVGVPPPLPVVESKPPLPLDDPPPSTHQAPLTHQAPPTTHQMPATTSQIYSTMPPNKIPTNNYTTAPPPKVTNTNFSPKTNQNNRNWSQHQQNNSRFTNDENPNTTNNNKRSFDQMHDNNGGSNNNEMKRLTIDQGPWQNPRQTNNYNQATTSSSVPKDNLEQLSEAEKKFDKQFADWEAQFNKWKEQNAEHPDKDQYREYEKKWEVWRAQLLERREQMKRKRLNLTSASTTNNNHNNKSRQPNFTQPPPKIQEKLSLKSDNFSKSAINNNYNQPPPNMNDEPLRFKPNESFLETKDSSSNDFFKPSASGGGIPGLDLVKDDPKIDGDDVVILEKEPEKKGPDFDAISKGINTILGDQKLLSMLSMVSQNPNLKPNDSIIDSVSRIKENEMKMTDNFQAPYNEQSNLSHDEKSNASDYYNNQREFVNNFDDQTRSSFTMGHNESDNMRYDLVGGGGSGGNNFNRNIPKFDQNNQFSNRFGGNFDNRSGNNENFNTNKNNFGRNRYDYNNTIDRQFGSKDGGGNNCDNFNRDQDQLLFNHEQYDQDYYNHEQQYNQNQFNNRIGGNNNFNKNNFRDGFNNRNNYNNNDNFNRDNINNRNSFNNNKGNFNHPNDDKFDEHFNYHDHFDAEQDFNKSIENEQNLQFHKDNFEEFIDPNINCGNVAPAPPPPLVEDDILKPITVIDYDHKLLKPAEPEVLIEPIHMFDYRHKPLNRIPFPQRPKWLSEEVKNIREFDPPIVRPYELSNLRRYPNDPYDRKYDSYMMDDRWSLQHGRRGFNDINRPPPLFDDRRQQYNERKIFDDNNWGGGSSNVDKRDDSYDRGGGGVGGQSDNRHFNERRSFNENRNNNNNNSSYDERKSYKDDRKVYEDDFGRSDQDKRSQQQQQQQQLQQSGNNWQDRSGNKDDNNIKIDKPSMNTSSNNKTEFSRHVTMIEDLISAPGRYKRPPRIVIILRGPPGSGKTFLAKLIKDKEVENGGSPPRILSLDDYFMIEQEKEITEDGKRIKIKEMVYEYEANMEESYRTSLIKSFKKTITDGYFPFIIVDNINDKVKYFGEMWSFAKQNGFQVYICQLELDVQSCTKRNIHGRSEQDIQQCVAAWEPTPAHHPVLDATSLIQSGSIPEVEMEEINSPASDDDCSEEGMEDQVVRSKWDNFDCSIDNLAKLDGVNKPLRHHESRTMEEYLQMECEWTPTESAKPGQKRVRWADLEEQREQKKMRALGFVVGQTNWNRMMDPSMGSSALTQTKYFEKSGYY